MDCEYHDIPTSCDWVGLCWVVSTAEGRHSPDTEGEDRQAAAAKTCTYGVRTVSRVPAHVLRGETLTNTSGELRVGPRAVTTRQISVNTGKGSRGFAWKTKSEQPLCTVGPSPSTCKPILNLSPHPQPCRRLRWPRMRMRAAASPCAGSLDTAQHHRWNI
jgi:hypothetical protein